MLKLILVNKSYKKILAHSIKIKGVKREDKYNKEKGIRSMEINWDDEGNMLVIRSDKEGKVEDTFASFTNPMSNKITSKIESLL